ncbi:SpoIID/LytB domain-containing protein [Polyangium aurulentum]|uniref:SpoIID/LytB domain-containing protein n=1 Tax=Polyangium aurulentum TaxID=2567896 RepID=UPI00146A26DF|nr:SpoIID/LytB domain-containing protein [Polyangium aurulentum]UQA60409.1 SpoIID/LytB domain-containing protein [Polyangium aurulentum]
MIAPEEPTTAPERILTEDGWQFLEEEYLPRVCAGEHRDAHPEAKAALVIAARTYILRAMRDRPELGRSEAVPNAERFQVFAAEATVECMAAARLTRGIVLRHRGRMIVANYVAGALWSADGSPGEDPTGTEPWVTYNAGRRGAGVTPTRLSLTTPPGNRGCMSQNGAQWLALHGWGHRQILRFFYGEDVEFFRLGAAGGAGLGVIVALAALGLAATAQERRRR